MIFVGTATDLTSARKLGHPQLFPSNPLNLNNHQSFSDPLPKLLFFFSLPLHHHHHCPTLSSPHFFWNVIFAWLVFLTFCSQQSRSAHILLAVLVFQHSYQIILTVPIKKKTIMTITVNPKTNSCGFLSLVGPSLILHRTFR